MNWIKSDKCYAGECVEVAFTKELVAVRSSKVPSEIVWFTKDEWEAFLAGAKLGQFNL